jgi:hypothetical protein
MDTVRNSRDNEDDTLFGRGSVSEESPRLVEKGCMGCMGLF